MPNNDIHCVHCNYFKNFLRVAVLPPLPSQNVFRVYKGTKDKSPMVYNSVVKISSNNSIVRLTIKYIMSIFDAFSFFNLFICPSHKNDILMSCPIVVFD